MRKTAFIICLVLVISLVMVACGEPQIENPSSDIIKFISQDICIYPGAMFQLKYANPEGKKIEFSSSDNSILTVDQNGIVTGISAGTATVIASTGEYEKAYVEITVMKDLMIAQINAILKANKIELLIGMDYDLGLSVQKNGQEVACSAEWSSSDNNVVTVADGKITAVAEGTAIITVEVTDGEEVDIEQCLVTVHPHYQVDIVQKKIAGTIGLEFSLDYKIYSDSGKLVTPAAGEVELITSNPSAVAIREDSFKIVGIGEASVGVRYKGNVTSIPVEIFSITADFFQKSAADFQGEVAGETFCGVCLTSSNYQPYFYFSADGVKAIRDYAEEYGYTTLRIHGYPILKDNGLVINGKYQGRDKWTANDFAVADIDESFYFWSQSQGTTEIYLWFEFK